MRRLCRHDRALPRESRARWAIADTFRAGDARDPAPRRYRTIFVCGAFGLGSTREQDFESLVRFRECLEPGGTLALDIGVPYADAMEWGYWLREERTRLPEATKTPRERRHAPNGVEYALGARILELDPLEQCVTLEMHAELWRHGTLEAEEDHTLTMNLYFKNELLLMLEQAGFADVIVRGDHNHVEATRDDDFLVLVAKAN